jgi:hypothetical protein
LGAGEDDSAFDRGDAERFMAQRIGAREVVELDSGHASLASRPKDVAELILNTARAF